MSDKTSIRDRGGIIMVCAICSVVIRFSAQKKSDEQRLYDEAMSQASMSSAVAA